MDSEAVYYIARLRADHETRKFRCGENSLDHFLRRHALDNQERDLGATYVVCVRNELQVCGYYTLSYGELAVDLLPEAVQRSLPRYPVPIVRLGRLAVDRKHQSKGLGGVLLVDAIRRAATLSDELGAFAIQVDALSDDAVRFYLYHEFEPLSDDHRHLYLPMSVARQV